MVHLRREPYQDLLLFPTQTEGLCQPGVGVMIQFQTGDEGVEETTRRARAGRACQVEVPVERPWDVRGVAARDPDGYRLRF